MILDEPKLTYEDKQEAGSGTPQHSPRSQEHRLTLETSASVLPLDSMVSTSPATPMPPEAPELPEEAKSKGEKDDSDIRKDPVTDA